MGYIYLDQPPKQEGSKGLYILRSTSKNRRALRGYIYLDQPPKTGGV